MTSPRILPLFAVAVIVAGVLVFVLDRQAGSAENIPLSTSLPVDVMPSHASPAGPRSPPAGTQPGSVAASAAAFEPSALEEMKARESRIQGRAGQLEQAWTSDRYDPGSSPQIEEGLVEKLTVERMLEVRDQPSRVVAVDCRSSLCRIEAVFPAGASASEWSTRLLLEMGGTFGATEMIASPGAEGEQRMVVYAYRAGREPR